MFDILLLSYRKLASTLLTRKIILPKLHVTNGYTRKHGKVHQIFFVNGLGNLPELSRTKELLLTGRSLVPFRPDIPFFSKE
jgi:hypothetical protein